MVYQAVKDPYIIDDSITEALLVNTKIMFM